MVKLILLKCGLANRLRTIVGFVYVGLMTNQEFEFHWDIKDQACNGSFNEHFNPLSIIYNNKKYNIKIKDTARDEKITYYFVGQETVNTIIQKEAPHLIPKNYASKDLYRSPFIQDIEKMIYSRIIPKHHIRCKIIGFINAIKRHRKKNIDAAMHIRRTDHSNLAKQNNTFTEDDAFIKFAEKHKDKIIFLATDEKVAQDQFLKRFKNIVVYKRISQSSNLRQTTLEDAIIDIFIASRASYFQGSGYSSYSHLINCYNKALDNKKLNLCIV